LRAAQHKLVQQLIRTEFQVTGKSLNKDEFVTCGGVRLGEVDFKTMESRICPGLYDRVNNPLVEPLSLTLNYHSALRQSATCD
jgi:hypothetical protein